MASKDKLRKDIVSPLIGQEDFQNSIFVAGYVSSRIKNNNDPLPGYLPGTVEWRKWMDGIEQVWKYIYYSMTRSKQ